MYTPKNIFGIISSKNVKLLKEKLEKNYFCLKDYKDFLAAAIKTENVEIVRIVIEKWPSEESIDEEHLKLYYSTDYYFLPYSSRKLIKEPNHEPPVQNILFKLIAKCCLKDNFALVELLINKFYSQKYNSLYPLIKRIQENVIGWPHICIFLNDDIWDLNKRYSKMGQSFGKVAESVIWLVLKDTRENLELAAEILQVFWAKKFNVKYFLAAAIGNTKAFEFIIDKWPSKEPIIDSEVVRKIIWSYQEQDKMLEVLQFLLPFIQPKDPERPGSVANDLLPAIMDFCSKKQFNLVEFFINNFYLEKYNSLYPLIRRLKENVFLYNWHNILHICIYLHDDIDIVYLDIDFLLELFKLYSREIRECKELAVETMQVLLSKEFRDVPEEFGRGALGRLRRDLHFSQVKQTLEDPLIRKLLFQFIYSSLNNKTNEQNFKNFDSLFKGFCERNISDSFTFKNFFFNEIHKAALEIMHPFMRNIREDFQEKSDQNEIRSLKEHSQDAIIRNVSNTKEFMDYILEVRLPTSCKCLLLHIPDASWMENIQIPKDQHESKNIKLI